MRARAATFAALVVASCALARLGGAQVIATPRPAPLPVSRLAVERDGAWHTWWRSDAAPAVWRAALPSLATVARWTPIAQGVERAELRLAGDGEAWRIRVILVRLAPSRLDLSLVEHRRAGGSGGAWTTDSLTTDAVFGLNAGQFAAGDPWGWFVRDGTEIQPPGSGALSTGVAITARGVALLSPAELERARASGDVRAAFQSYPTLLAGNGDVPAALARSDGGIDVSHRDARVAIGTLRDGRLLVALTRFDALGAEGGMLPFGLTIPEMAALMGAMGCDRAVALDGGISAQLALRSRSGRVEAWRGLRPVPVALVARPRAIVRP